MHLSRQAVWVLAGSSYERDVEVLEDDGSVFDLTGYNVYLQIDRPNGTASLRKDIRSNLLATTPEHGIIHLTFPSSVTREWAQWPRCTYSLLIDHRKAELERVMTGSFIVRGDVAHGSSLFDS